MDDYDSDDDEYVFMFLLDRFPGWDEALAAIKKHETVKRFRSFASKKMSPLTAKEIDKALDPEYIPWNKFHSNLLQSIGDARGKSKTGASRGSVLHMNTKCKLKEKFCESHIEDFDTEDRQDAWRSVLQSFACIYIEEIENNADKARDELSKQIDDILATPWKPMDKIHEECIYFIVGAMVKAANDKIQQQKTSDSLRESLRSLVMLQTTTKDEAKEAEAPTRRVERREAVSLNYASKELYDVICKYESVYHTLLNEDGIKKYGEGLLKQINALLSRKDVGMKDLLSVWADHNDAREVSTFFLNYYTNLRGKDYARKYNAQIISSTETHRATIGVTHELAKKKHEKDRKRESQKEQTEKDGGKNFEAMLLPKLRELCGEKGLIKGGKKADVIKRLRDHIENEMRAEPAPAEETMEDTKDDEDEEEVAEEEEEKDESTFDKMRNKQLKALCREYGLRVGGNRSVLLSRLRDYYKIFMTTEDESEESVSGDEEEDDDGAEEMERSHLNEEDMVAMYGSEDDSGDLSNVDN